MYFNKAIIIGNLTRDPELRSTPAGVQVANIGIATNRVWKDKNGAKQEATDYHNVVVFGRQAETAAQYLKKGASVMIEGRLQTRSWDGQDGKKNYRTEIVADRVQFGPRREGASSTPTSEAVGVPTPPPEEGVGIDYPQDNVNVDDIPF